MNKTKHFNINSNQQSIKTQQLLSLKKSLPKHIVRDIEIVDGQYGSGGLCSRCHNRFREHYMKRIVLGNFRYGWVCRDCFNKKNDVEI